MKKLLLGTAISLAMVGGASAADMYVKAAPVWSWTGFYVGANGGWAQDTFTVSTPVDVQPNAKGGAFGGHAGFNWQWNRLVLGVEGDGDWLNLKASAPCFNPAFTCSTELDSQYSFRGRLGFAFDRMLIYGTGGAAWTTFKGSTALGATVFPGSVNKSGWIAGGGLEWAVTNNFILGAEYLHADFGKTTQTYDVVYPDIGLRTDIVRARASFLFGGPH